jgi:hypothetical protein
MAAKKKVQKKQTKSKRTAGKKAIPKKKLSNKKAILKQKSARKKPTHKKATAKRKAVGRKAASAKTVSAAKRRFRQMSETAGTATFSQDRSRARSGGQSGDLQGLSGVERADSESVDELLEEGNAFEADIVSGVEDAGNADEKEVRTHEVPEDDVPGEYLDKER